MRGLVGDSSMTRVVRPGWMAACTALHSTNLGAALSLHLSSAHQTSAPLLVARLPAMFCLNPASDSSRPVAEQARQRQQQTGRQDQPGGR